MKEKKEPKAASVAQKVTIKADKAIAVYNIINARTNKEAGIEGFKVTHLDTKDLFIFLRARNTLRPVAEAYAQFEKSASEDLRPEDWEQIVEKSRKFNELTDEEKIAVNKAAADYQEKVRECLSTELQKDKEVDTYDHLSEEAFCTLVKDNPRLDAVDVALLQELLA